MTGNVAQIFLDDSAWASTLRALHTALRPGGYLAFESLNPAARAWDQWGRDDTFERVDTPFGPMAYWLEVVSVSHGKVRFEGHNVFEATGEDLIASSELRFRSKTELASSLVDAGFTVMHVYGDWRHGLFAEASRVMVFVARRD
jgi:hypothetical protein